MDDNDHQYHHQMMVDVVHDRGLLFIYNHIRLNLLFVLVAWLPCTGQKRRCLDWCKIDRTFVWWAHKADFECFCRHDNRRVKHCRVRIDLSIYINIYYLHKKPVFGLHVFCPFYYAWFSPDTKRSTDPYDIAMFLRINGGFYPDRRVNSTTLSGSSLVTHWLGRWMTRAVSTRVCRCTTTW